MFVEIISILFEDNNSKLKNSEQASGGLFQGDAPVQDRVRHGYGSDQLQVDHPDLGRGFVWRSVADHGLLGQDPEVECSRSPGENSICRWVLQ